jgi:hypothetical protein
MLYGGVSPMATIGLAPISSSIPVFFGARGFLLTPALGSISNPTVKIGEFSRIFLSGVIFMLLKLTMAVTHYLVCRASSATE